MFIFQLSNQTFDHYESLSFVILYIFIVLNHELQIYFHFFLNNLYGTVTILMQRHTSALIKDYSSAIYLNRQLQTVKHKL